jgi:hypothetical protein
MDVVHFDLQAPAALWESSFAALQQIVANLRLPETP